jgi:hypothetical protein
MQLGSFGVERAPTLGYASGATRLALGGWRPPDLGDSTGAI